MEVNLLPFLQNKNRNVAGLIIKKREPDVEKVEENQVDDPSMAIEACADAMIDAMHNRDAKALASALKDAFDILESLPHDEVNHDEPGDV